MIDFFGKVTKNDIITLVDKVTDLRKTYVDSRKEYKSKNYIPLDSDLKFENFPEFFHKREDLIKSELMKILEVDKT